MLLIEGEDDKIALTGLLRNLSTTLAAAIDSGKLAIESLNGGSNLAYKAGLMRDALLCVCHAFLDSDTAGKAAARKAIDQGVLQVGDINFASAMDLKGDSELEDLYDPSAYRDIVFSTFGVDISTNPKFKNPKKKWSERMAEVFAFEGKQWDDGIKIALKSLVARHVAKNPQNALHPHRNGTIGSLAAALEKHCS